MTIGSRPVGFWVVAAMIGLLAAASAEAGSIKLSDGTTTLIITDQDFVPGPGAPADMSGVPGVVAFVGSLGGWSFSLTTGTTKPAVGSSTEPVMELRDITLTSSAAGGTISIWFSEVGFGPTGSLAESSISGGTGGTVKFETFKGTALFDETVALSSLSFGSGLLSGTDSKAMASVGGPYSLTEKVTITHGGGFVATGLKGTLSVSSTASSVPDGGMTLSMLGVALIALAGLRRLQRD